MKNYKQRLCSRILLFFLFGASWSLADGAILFALDSTDDKQRRNPFTLPEGVATRSKLARKSMKEKLVLQAVTIANGDKRIASISGENVVVGDEIYGRKVLIIGEDFVVLERGPEKMRLTLERRPFSVQVRPDSEAPQK